MDEEKTGKGGININVVPDSIDESAKELIKPSATELGNFFSSLIYLATGGIQSLADRKRIQRAHDLEVFKKELEKKIEDKPQGCLVEPRLQVVGPAIENSKYCLEEPRIREMFQNLLANAADERFQSKVHPSFSAMIAQMSPLDAENLALFDESEVYPVVKYSYKRSNGNKVMGFTNCFLENKSMTDINSLKLQAASLSSLERQGLIGINYVEWLTAPDSYLEFEKTSVMHEMKFNVEIMKHHPNADSEGFESVSVDKGIARLTPLGRVFVDVCFHQ